MSHTDAFVEGLLTKLAEAMGEETPATAVDRPVAPTPAAAEPSKGSDKASDSSSGSDPLKDRAKARRARRHGSKTAEFLAELLG